MPRPSATRSALAGLLVAATAIFAIGVLLERSSASEVHEVEERMAALASLKDDLLALVARCGTECATSCTVLIDAESLASATPADGGSAVAESRAMTARRTVP